MVAKIAIGKNIRGILNYNERKVVEDGAQLILASGFACDLDRLTILNKVQRFRHLIDLKPTVKTNALHISLNFDADEKIGNEKMRRIAMDYMDRIGFGEQPYLVYRHNDAAHQHIHIATVSINRNGEAIGLHNLGRDRSEPARKAIEKLFHLTVAESRKFKPDPAIKPVDIKRAQYGFLPTKRAISNVISTVAANYAFTSFAEYNAILRQFNVIAEKGIEGTEMFKNKGLVYSLLNPAAEKVGVPIKASAFYTKPTLSNLEKLFAKGEEKRKQFKPDITQRIDKVLFRYDRITRQTLISELQKSGISLVFRKNVQGAVYGITFIDNQNKAVFNGSDLGRVYSAKSLLEKIGSTDVLKTYLQPLSKRSTYLPAVNAEKAPKYLESPPPTNFLDILLSKPQNDQAVGIPTRKRKRRRGFRI